MDPICSSGGASSVEEIAIVSPIDTVIAVGRATTLSAEAIDGAGDPVPATFVWSSTNTATASVSAAGEIAAQAKGTTTILATTDGVTGELRMRAVNAELPAVTTLLTDPYVQALSAALGATAGGEIGDLLSACASNVGIGHVRAIDDCLGDAGAVEGSGGSDEALLGVLGLFLDQARRKLDL